MSNSFLFTGWVHKQELQQHGKGATKASANKQGQQEIAAIPQHAKGQRQSCPCSVQGMAKINKDEGNCSQ